MFQLGIIKSLKNINFQEPFIIQEKCDTSIETSLPSNALKASVNEIENTQEKDVKTWRSIEKDYFENFALV